MQVATNTICSCFFQAWVGHPYYDVIDNTTDFENKINRMIAVSIYSSSTISGRSGQKQPDNFDEILQAKA